ncbi:amidohydrolase family-domain-containing protein [Salix suchowensis]|nr:amidohydrolase family-domain-containing protein [Salix suchowensis]
MSLSRQRRSGCTQAPIGVRTTTKKAEKVVVSVEPVFAESSRNAKILVAVACLAVLSWFASAPARSTVPASEVAKPYALCTPDGPKIYTVDELRPNVKCLVVQGAFIVATGNLYSHGHILEYGASRELLLDGAASVQDAVARVREYVLANRDVYKDTTRYILVLVGITPFGPEEDLETDSILKGRPIVLQSKDCHALWLSPKAAEASLPFPDAVEGGVIVRDKLGKPTGVFLDNAQELVKQPPVTEADLLKRFATAVKDAHRFGLTSIHDAGLDPTSLKFFKRYVRIATDQLPCA